MLRKEIRHAPGPEGTRRFRLQLLATRRNEYVLYGAAFETDDPLLAGEMKLHFTLIDALAGTRVVLRHEGLPEKISLADNARGTASSLENLARFIESRSKPGSPAGAE